MGIEQGKYFIDLVKGPENPAVRVGVDTLYPPPPVRFVAAYGYPNIFTVQNGPKPGQYIFTIRNEFGTILYYIQRSADNRVIASPKGPPTVWDVVPQDGGHYTILDSGTADPPLGWTLEAFESNDPVILDPVPVPPTEFQLWDFVGPL